MTPLGLRLLMLTWLLACGDPVADSIAAYHGSMDPLMTENTRLATLFLGLAKSIHKKELDADQVAQHIEREIVPPADALQASISSITTDLEELADVHQQAITAWGLQAQAYRELVAAYQKNDLKAFTAAHKKLGQAKVTIENYVKEVNRLLEPYGYHLDEFPQGQ